MAACRVSLDLALVAAALNSAKHIQLLKLCHRMCASFRFLMRGHGFADRAYMGSTIADLSRGSAFRGSSLTCTLVTLVTPDLTKALGTLQQQPATRPAAPALSLVLA